MKFKLLLIILLILFVVGCKNNNDIQLPDVVDYHSGTQGLSMKFLENLPPDEVWEDSEFTISLELQNKGPTTIENGFIVIGGFDPSYIELGQDQIDFELQARSPSYPEGDYKIVHLKAKNINLPKGTEEYPAAFTARAYYDYKTEATINVCINPNIYDYEGTDETGCEVKPIELAKGQGAPIAVIKVEERISPLTNTEGIEIEFKIYIENKADGEVIENIKIDEVILTDKKLKCNLLELKIDPEDKENSFSCKTTLENTKSAYISPLIIKLSYKYSQKLDKSFKIVALTN